MLNEKQVRESLYLLRVERGVNIDYYTLTSSYNLSTGGLTETTSITRIKKAIVLPKDEASNTRGYDDYDVIVIISKDSVPASFTLDSDAKFTIHGITYRVTRSSEIQQGLAYKVWLRSTSNTEAISG